MVNEHDGIDQQALDDYAKLLEQSFSESHIHALAALFNWDIPRDLNQDSGGAIV